MPRQKVLFMMPAPSKVLNDVVIELTCPNRGKSPPLTKLMCLLWSGEEFRNFLFKPNSEDCGSNIMLHAVHSGDQKIAHKRWAQASLLSPEGTRQQHQLL
eukprot:6203499-Amphidinium_carterae.1